MKVLTRPKLDYNAPFTLTFCLLAALIFSIGSLTGGLPQQLLFSIGSEVNWSNPLTYIQLFGHVLGHASFEHLLFNITILLLIGPMLEEMYGEGLLILLTCITALITGLLMIFVFNGRLLGASGVVFSMIVLSSFANSKSKTIPLTFVFVVVIFLGNEIYNAIAKEDNIAQFAHITGGLVGGIFGLFLAKRAESPWKS